MLRLRNPQLPGQARALDARPGRGSRAAVAAGHDDVVGFSFCDSRGDDADADLAHELDTDLALRVRALQVVDELSQIFYRVDVVVRRGRDETNAGRRAPTLGAVVTHLETREFAAFPRLGPLRHLDLDLVAVR